MSAEIVYCASGCVTKGEHVLACDGTACDGCRPRHAEHGVLCRWCYSRLTVDVHDTPALVAHLVEIGRPFAQVSPPSDTRSYRDPAFGTLRPPSWDAADELHAMLASWARCVLEEHPDGERMTGPDESGTVQTQAVTVMRGDLAAEVGAYTRISTVAGLSAPDPMPTVRLCAWLTPLLPWIAGQEWAAEMRREVKEAIGTARSRWPEVETRARHIGGVQCVRCGNLGLTYRPVNFPGASALITCTHPECGTIVSERDYEGALGRLAIERGYVA